MTGSKSSRRLLIVLALLVLVGVGIFLISRRGSSPADESYEYADKDTGETISVQPGVTPEKFGDSDQVTVIGLTSLAGFGSASLSDVQLPVFRKDLAEKGIRKLPEHDQIIKIVNPLLNPATIDFEAELIYKEGAPKARIVFDIPDNYVFSYQISLADKIVYSSERLVADNVGELPH